MAKKQNLKTGDPGLDDDLDLDFGYLDFDLKPPKDDRNPITKVASGMKQGMKETFTDPAFIAKTMKKAMPKDYGVAFDMADQAATGLRDLYNTAADEMRPVAKELKRTTGKLVNVVGDKLPEGVRRRMEAWAKDEKDASKDLNKVNTQEFAIHTTLTQIFGEQQKVDQDRENDRNAKEAIQESVERRRYEGNFGQLNSIRLATTALSAYQQNIGANFQRKSLELHYRQYFVMAELLAETKRSNELSKVSLEGILKNTGLPDFVKMQSKEFLAQTMRNQFTTSVQKGLFGDRRDFIKNLTEDLVKRGKKGIQNFKNSALSSIGHVDMALDSASMAKDLGVEIDPHTLGGNILGGGVASMLGAKFAKWLNKKLEANKDVMKGANYAAYVSENLPKLIKEYSETQTERTGWHGRLIDGAKGILRDQFSRAQQLQVDSAKSMQEPGLFTRQSNRSLNEVIPGYLARIFRELQVLRTGNDKIDLMTFDYDTGKFSKQTDIKNKMVAGLFSDWSRESTKRHSEGLMDKLDPTGTKLTKEQREALSVSLLRDNANNKLFDKKRMTDVRSYTGAAAKHAKTYADLFSEYYGDDESYVKQLAFSREANALGTNIRIDYERLQNLVNLGYADTLKEAGIINERGEVNEKAIVEMYLNGHHQFKMDKPLKGKAKLRAQVAQSVVNNVVTNNYNSTRNTTNNHYRTTRVNNTTHNKTTNVRPQRLRLPPRAQRVSPVEERMENADYTPSHIVPLVRPEHHGQSSNLTGKNHQANHGGFKDIVAAIEKYNVKEETIQIRDMIGAIGMMLSKGIRTYGVQGIPGDSGGNDGPWYDQTVSELFRKGWKGAQAFGKKSFSWMKTKRDEIKEKAVEFGHTAAEYGAKGLQKGKEFGQYLKKRAMDIYVEGRNTVIMTADMMRNGEYIDVNTGKIIRGVEDITGEVRNKLGEVIMTAEQARRAYARGTIGVRMLRSLGKLKDKGAEMITNAMGMYGTALRAGKALLRQGQEKAMQMLDQPVDIYIKGHLDVPVMTAIQMRGGNYRSRLTGRKIMRPSQIDGVVENMDGEVVLTDEQIRKGLVNADGKPLRTGLGKLAQMVGDGFHAVKRFAKNTINKIGGVIGGVFGGIGDFFKGWIGPDGIIFAGGKKMLDAVEEIRDILKTRLPENGRIRKGSVDDINRHRKEDADKADKKKEDSKNESAKGYGIMAGIKGLMDKFKGKKKGDDDDSDGKSGWMDKLADAADIFGGKGKGALKTAGRWGKAGLGKIGKFAKWGKGLGAGLMLSGAGMAADKMGYNNVGTALDYAGTGVSLYGAASTAAGLLGVEGGLAGAATAAAGGLGSLATGAGGVLAAIGGAISAPVLLGAAAVAAVGIGGYMLYKHFQNKMSPIDKFRYAQYGFDPEENKYYGLIKKLEDNCRAGVSIESGVASLTEKNLKVKSIAEDFGVDMKNIEQVKKFIAWFRGRFKPVYLTHMTALFKVKRDVKTLDDVNSKFTGEEKVKYLNMVKFSEGPYNFMVSPTPDLKDLPAGRDKVEAAFKAAMDDATKEQDKKDDKKGKGVVSAAAAAGAAGMAQKAQSAKADPNAPPLKKVGEKPETLADTLAKQSGKGANDYSKINSQGMRAGVGVLTIAGTAEPIYQAANGRIDGLTAVRFKAYGLVEMEANKIQALASLENEVQKSVKINSVGKAEWSGALPDIVNKMATSFGVDINSKSATELWSRWFTMRFLPVYLNFVTLVKSFTNRIDPIVGSQSLKSDQLVNVATALIGTNGEGGTPVWAVTFTPWPGYKTNRIISTTDANIAALKAQMSKDKLAEQKGQDKDKASDQKSKVDPSGANTAEDKKNMSIIDRVTSGAKSAWNAVTNTVSNAASAVGGAVSNAASAVGGALSSAANYVGDLVGGNAMQHPGAGTGGDINKIPLPKGDGSYGAMREMFDAVGKMVGIDPKVMASMAGIESGFHAGIKAGTSSATGLFQFISGTWAGMMKKYAAKYGIAPGTPPTDARANAILGAEYIKENANILKSVKPNLTDTDVYMAHFLGAGGAKKFFQLAPGSVAAQGMPKEAAANKPIFYKKDGSPRTVAEVYQLMNEKMQNSAKKLGLNSGVSGAGSQAIVPSKNMPAQPAAANQAKPAANAAAPAAAAVAAAPSVAPANAKPPMGAAPSGAPSAAANAAPAKGQAKPAQPAATPVLAQAAATGYATTATPQKAVAQQKQANDGTGFSDVTDILSKSHLVHVDALKVLKSILDAIQKGGIPSNGKQQASGDRPVQPAQTAQKTPKAASELPRPPVDISKATY